MLLPSTPYSNIYLPLVHCIHVLLKNELRRYTKISIWKFNKLVRQKTNITLTKCFYNKMCFYVVSDDENTYTLYFIEALIIFVFLWSYFLTQSLQMGFKSFSSRIPFFWINVFIFSWSEISLLFFSKSINFLDKKIAFYHNTDFVQVVLV